jgi:hypothetical protein
VGFRGRGIVVAALAVVAVLAVGCSSGGSTLVGATHANQVLVPIKGFTYRDVSPDVRRRTEAAVKNQEGVGAHLVDFEIKYVLDDNQTNVGLVEAIAVDSQSANAHGAEGDFAKGLAGGLGSTAKKTELSGDTVYEIPVTKGALSGGEFVAWQEGNVFIAVFSAVPSKAEAIGSALVAALNDQTFGPSSS